MPARRPRPFAAHRPAATCPANGCTEVRLGGAGRRLAPLLAAATLAGALPAAADLASFVNNDPFFNALERRAAIANQNTFNELDPLCSSGISTRCSAAQAQVYENVRELVHTANELQGSGAIDASLQLDREGLGFALRWTAAEETAAQGASSTEFTNGQIANLASRMTALRFGARGFQITGTGLIPNEQMAALANAARGRGLATGLRGGAASDDAEQAEEGSGENGEPSTQFSRVGGFLNVSYGYGDREPTQLEDAFDFEALEVTGGIDYRFDNGLVIGATAGGTFNEVDFDSVKSIVDGGVKGDGFSVSTFAMYSPSAWYVSAFGSAQFMRFEMTRFIKYPSFNPDRDNVNTATLSETDSTTLTFELATGYNFNWSNFSVEPYAKATYLSVTIDGFTEQDLASKGFDFVIDEQQIDSAEVAAGLRATYVWTPSFGVFMPYARVEAIHEFQDDSRKISAVYRSVSDLANAKRLDFNVPTEDVDPDYFTASVGLSAIVRGGRPDDDGVIHGGIQVFVEYRTLIGLEDISNHVFSGGLRYEF